MNWVGKQERNKPLGEPVCSCVDDVKLDIKEIGWGCVDWIGRDQGRDQ
jgi:hypothetical protein